MNELTRRALVEEIENIIADYDERQLDTTDIEGMNREQLECISEFLQFGQAKIDMKNDVPDINAGNMGIIDRIRNRIEKSRTIAFLTLANSIDSECDFAWEQVSDHLDALSKFIDKESAKEPVCEWKYWIIGSFHETECGKNVVYDHDGDEEFRYCPYCGKKIEVRE